MTQLKFDNETQEKVYNLIKEQFEKMVFSKKYNNQAILTNKCQAIIYDDWGIGTQGMWDLVDKYVKVFIPDEE